MRELQPGARGTNQDNATNLPLIRVGDMLVTSTDSGNTLVLGLYRKALTGGATVASAAADFVVKES